MDSLVATRDPVLQAAARIAGFAEAMVQDTDTGRVVLCRRRYLRHWTPFGHLEPGECAINVFYGTAFWEQPQVLAMYERQRETRLVSLAGHKADVSKDFRRELHKQIVKRPDGRNDFLDALKRMGAAR